MMAGFAFFVYFILASFLLIVGISFHNASKSFAPFVPCSRKELPRIFDAIQLREGEVFYDLGSGDGRIVFYAGENFPVKAIGVEMSFLFFLYSQIKKLFVSEKSQIVFKMKDLFFEDLSQADAIYVYGMPKVLEKKLRFKLEKELKKGARVIAYGFPIKGLVPEKIYQPTRKGEKPIHIYRF
jgi:SAM-dependent methyltransferase